MDPDQFAQRLHDIEQFIHAQPRFNVANFYYYQGSCIDTTRPFCRALSGKAWHRQELAEFALAGMNKPWKGMRKGTNPTTILLFVGGYGCRHILVPISKRDVPTIDLERMRSKGLIP